VYVHTCRQAAWPLTGKVAGHTKLSRLVVSLLECIYQVLRRSNK